MGSARTSIVVLAVVGLAITWLTGCGGSSGGSSGGGGGGGGGGTSAAGAPSTPSPAAAAGEVTGIDPCSLLTDAEVATIAPGLGHGVVDQVAGAKICDWPDAHGIPAVQLQVTAPQSALKSELQNGVGAFGGYAVVSVSGLGDEAAAAFQTADPAKGLTAGMATLIARSGDKAIGLSTPRVTIAQGSAAFATAKGLVAKALARL